MNTDKERPTPNTTSSEANGWKSSNCRKMMVKKMVEYLTKHGPSSWAQNIPALIQSVERFEEKVFASSQLETEYTEKISTKMKAIRPQLQNAKDNFLAGNSSESGEASMEWKEQVYQQVQQIKVTYLAKLEYVYELITKKLQRLRQEPIPQQIKTFEMEKCESHKRALEYIFSLLNVEKSQITPHFKQKLNTTEKYIHTIIQHNFVSSHDHQDQNFVDVPSIQQFVPSTTSATFQANMPHKKPPSQVMNLLSSSQLAGQIPHRDKLHSIDHQVASQVSVKKASTLVENNGNMNEQTLTLDDASPAMQRLIRALTSISDEALMAATNDIEAVLRLNDDISILEPLIIATHGSVDTALEGINLSHSQERYLNFPDLFPMEKKMNRFINSTPVSGSSIRFTSVEKPLLKSITSQGKSIFEEIKEINNVMIDTEIVICEGNTIPRVIKGAEEHGEGLVLKLLFNSVSINLPLTSKYASDKKSMIKPLHLLVPLSYPHRSPIILDETPFEIRFDSKDLDDLLVKAKLKLKFSLYNKNQPLSLQAIATSWDSCVREAICEYAQLHGGGTFSSKYGEWEICPNSD